jgi:hypothetical protein
VPTPGLSLVGFIADQQQALTHLKTPCLPDPTKSDADLLADWNAARAKLGRSIARAGHPNLQPIPVTDPHIQQLLNAPWAAGYLAHHMAQGASFQMVEIDPLLAYQFTVDAVRSNSHCGTLSRPPTRAELFNVCLPLVTANDAVHISDQGHSFIVKSRSLNLQIAAQGAIQNMIGIQCSWSLPFVHVTRFNGRCYLHNGYHRALGIRRAGASEMPCFLRDAPDAGAAGIQPPGTFDLQLLESGNPPTIGHFTRRGRALKVRMRASMRVIQISWSQHTMFDE